MIAIYLDSEGIDFSELGEWVGQQDYPVRIDFNRDANMWYFVFSEPDHAMHFKLTWGGVAVNV